MDFPSTSSRPPKSQLNLLEIQCKLTSPRADITPNMFTPSSDLTAVASASICCCSSVSIRLLLQNVTQTTSVHLFGFGGQTVERLLAKSTVKFRVWSPPDGTTVHELRCHWAKRDFSVCVTFLLALVGIHGNPAATVLNYSNTNGRWSPKDIRVSFIMLVSGCSSQTLWLRSDFMRSNSWTPSLPYYCPWRWSSRSFLTRPKALIFLVCSFDPLALFVWSPGRRSAFLWFLSLRAPTWGTAGPATGRGAFIAIQISGILFGQEELRAQESKFTVVTFISKPGHAYRNTQKKNLQWVRLDGKAHRCRCEPERDRAPGAQSAASLCFVTLYCDSSTSQRQMLYCLHSSDNLNYKLPFFLCVFWPYW